MGDIDGLNDLMNNLNIQGSKTSPNYQQMMGFYDGGSGFDPFGNYMQNDNSNNMLGSKNQQGNGSTQKGLNFDYYNNPLLEIGTLPQNQKQMMNNPSWDEGDMNNLGMNMMMGMNRPQPQQQKKKSKKSQGGKNNNQNLNFGQVGFDQMNFQNKNLYQMVP